MYVLQSLLKVAQVILNLEVLLSEPFAPSDSWVWQTRVLEEQGANPLLRHPSDASALMPSSCTSPSPPPSLGLHLRLLPAGLISASHSPPVPCPAPSSLRGPCPLVSTPFAPLLLGARLFAQPVRLSKSLVILFSCWPFGSGLILARSLGE